MRSRAMKGVLSPLGVLAFCFVLNRRLLPRKGVPT